MNYLSGGKNLMGGREVTNIFNGIK